MPRIGDTIRPELGKIDYRPMMITGMKAAESRGKSMGNLIGKVEGAFEQKRTNEGKIGATKKKLKGVADFLPEDSQIGQMATRLHEELSDPEYRMSELLQTAAAAESSLAFASDHIEKQFGRKMREEGMGISRRNAALGQEKFDYGKTEAARLEKKDDTRARALADAQRDYMAHDGDPKLLNALIPPLPGGSGIGGLPGVLPPNETPYEGFYRDALSGLMIEHGKTAGKGGTQVIKETLPSGEEVEHTWPTINGVPDKSGDPLGTVRRHKPPGQIETVDEEIRRSEKKAHSDAATAEVHFVIDSSKNSRVALAKMRRVEQLLKNEDVYTGKFSELIAGFQEVGHFLGMEPAGLNEFQEMNVYLGDFVMQRIGQTKGAVSEKEMELFRLYSANPDKTKEANLAIVRALQQVEQRRMDLATRARRWAREGVPSMEITQRLEDYMDMESPLDFSDAEGKGGYGWKGDPKTGAGDFLRSLDAARAKAKAEGR